MVPHVNDSRPVRRPARHAAAERSRVRPSSAAIRESLVESRPVGSHEEDVPPVILVPKGGKEDPFPGGGERGLHVVFPKHAEWCDALPLGAIEVDHEQTRALIARYLHVQDLPPIGGKSLW